MKDFSKGSVSSERFLFVPGVAGSGKSFTLERVFSQIPEFQPRHDERGIFIRPLISATTRKQATTKDILIMLLEEMDLPAEGSERALTKLLQEQLRAQKVHYVHMDEFQHSLRSGTPKTIEGVQDALKNLVAMPDWPLHIILSGVPRLDKLRVDDNQIMRRSHVVPFRPLKVPDDNKFIMDAMKTVIVDHCGLEMDETLLDKNFPSRLCRAKIGGWGSIIEMVQNACFTAIENGRPTVTVKHFAYLYRINTGCIPKDNIFTSNRWKLLKPQNSLIDFAEDA
ncbi:ATP-binding protein [Rhizobium sp.]|uniref:ATP-binding protein n=1 Tax=Rhizobium sp. TaxID=391 RepID=UPI0028A09BAE